MQIKEISATKLPDIGIKRVAAYARVSSDKEAAIHSLSSQISYYNEYISNHVGWEFAGVYADEGITGTKDNRPEFMRLLEDCRKGKIDLVITKSITRFARNTVVLLDTIRELKLLEIDVFFEKENMHSMRNTRVMHCCRKPIRSTISQKQSRKTMAKLSSIMSPIRTKQSSMKMFSIWYKSNYNDVPVCAEVSEITARSAQNWSVEIAVHFMGIKSTTPKKSIVKMCGIAIDAIMVVTTAPRRFLLKMIW